MHLRAEAVCGGSAALMCGPVLIGADGWDVRAPEGGISRDGIRDVSFCTWA